MSLSASNSLHHHPRRYIVSADSRVCHGTLPPTPERKKAEPDEPLEGEEQESVIRVLYKTELPIASIYRYLERDGAHLGYGGKQQVTAYYLENG